MRTILLPTMLQTPHSYRRMNRHCLYPVPVEETVAGILQDMLPFSQHRSHVNTDTCMFQPRHIQVCPRSRRTSQRVAPWEHIIHLPGFEPSNIGVKIDGDNFVVNAKRHIQNGDNYDVTETRRSVRIPDTVDKDTIRCYLRHDGKMVITATHKVSETTNDQVQQRTPVSNCNAQKRKASPLALADLFASLLFEGIESSAQKKKQEMPKQSEETSEKQTTQVTGCSDGNRQADDPTRPVHTEILTAQAEQPAKGTLSKATPTERKSPQVGKGERNDVSNTTTDEQHAGGASNDADSPNMHHKRQKDIHGEEPVSVDSDNTSVIHPQKKEPVHTEEDQEAPDQAVTEKEDKTEATDEISTDVILKSYEVVDDMDARQEKELTGQNDEHGFESSMEPSCDEDERQSMNQECILEEPHELEGKTADVEPSEDEAHIIKRDGERVFQIELDSSDFKPDDISVRCEGRVLYVDGKSNGVDRECSGFKEFHRKYTVPIDAHVELAKASMTDGGFLRITVPFAGDVAEVPIVLL